MRSHNTSPETFQMPKTTYTVTAPNGAVFTRKSDRVYTHAVLCQDSYEGWMQTYDAIWEVDKSNFRYAEKIVATNGEYLAGKVYNEEQRERVEAANAKRLANAKAEVETHKTANAFAAAMRALRVASLNAKLKAGGFDGWMVEGFCGRHDLAVKLAAKVTGTRHNATIVAVSTK